MLAISVKILLKVSVAMFTFVDLKKLFQSEFLKSRTKACRRFNDLF